MRYLDVCAGVSERNAHGVYTNPGILALPRGKKGWDGVPLAEIRVAETPGGWRWGTSFQLYGDDHWGSSAPVTDHSPVAASCDDAVRAAADHLSATLASRDCVDALAIKAWCDEIAQPVLL